MQAGTNSALSNWRRTTRLTPPASRNRRPQRSSSTAGPDSVLLSPQKMRCRIANTLGTAGLALFFSGCQPTDDAVLINKTDVWVTVEFRVTYTVKKPLGGFEEQTSQPQRIDVPPGGTRALGYVPTGCVKAVSGVVYSPCGVNINGAGTNRNMTIIALGPIRINGSAHNIRSAASNVALLSATSITINGSNNSVDGTLETTGPLVLNGSGTTLSCGIVAQNATFNGSRQTVKPTCPTL
jgi:hypothetical protein